MKIEDNCPIDVTFRTSRTGKCFGSLLLITGLGLLWHIYTGNPFLCGFRCLLIAGILAAMASLLLGVLVMTYRKCVVISKTQRRIEFMESSLLMTRRATFDFQEVRYLELCSIGECLFHSHACLWTVKAYVQRGPKLEAVRLFESLSHTLADEGAHTLSQIVGRPLSQTRPNPTTKLYAKPSRAG